MTYSYDDMAAILENPNALTRLRNLKSGNLHHAVETVSGFQVI